VTRAGHDVPEWRYFAEALSWYDGQNLTGAQTFGVIQQVRQALRDGRITPADLGMHKVDPFEVFTASDGDPAIRGRNDVWALNP
jgi:hypothetical protein